MSPIEKDNNVKVKGKKKKKPKIDGKPQSKLVFLNFLIERCANDY